MNKEFKLTELLFPILTPYRFRPIVKSLGSLPEF